MELNIVIDNLPADEALLHSEHGLCLHFSIDGKNYLVDTGASGKAMENMVTLNAGKKGVPLPDNIEAVFISHGHNDHTGGLREFIGINSTAPIYLHKEIKGNLFFSCRPKNGIMEARSTGIEQALFAEYGERFKEIGEITAVTDKITLVPVGESGNHSKPKGNEFLYRNDFPDNFSHEIAILLEYAPLEYAVISPCTHNGILNTLECCRKFILSKGRNGEQGVLGYFIGGLHYVDYLAMGEGEKEAASIIETARILKRKYPFLKLFSGHCTCCNAANLLKRELGENYTHFHTGESLQII